MAARRSFRHINDIDRIKIEMRVKDGRTPREIADELGFHISTIYRELERGTNENINRMIRWHFPKGTSFDEITAREVAEVAVWINGYPREILDYASAEMLFTAELSLAA